MGDVIAMRPKCEVPGCGKNAHNTNTTANPRYRKAFWVREEFGVENGYVCGKHHFKNYGIGGWEYKIYREDHRECENKDGHLNFPCTFVLPDSAILEGRDCDVYEIVLQVDHIDGNHLNNDPENLQVLCANCHSLKSYMNYDYASPGRKTRVA